MTNLTYEEILLALPLPTLREALDSHFAGDAAQSPESAVGGFLDNLNDSCKEDAVDSVMTIVETLGAKLAKQQYVLTQVLRALALLSPATHDGLLGDKIRTALTK